MAREAAQPQDQSMEEILQSIKRIIAEENLGTPEEPAGGKEKSKKAEPQKNGAKSADVLELTDIADDDEDAEDAPVNAPENVAAVTTPAPPPKPTPEPVVSGMRTESILEAVERSAAAPLHQDVLVDIDSLLSSEAAKASARALKSIPPASAAASAAKTVNPGLPFRAGTTVEDLAMEALRPMLKDWLDSNLPGIVERLVEREIRKLSSL